jgi:hypothetical protein
MSPRGPRCRGGLHEPLRAAQLVADHRFERFEYDRGILPGTNESDGAWRMQPRGTWHRRGPAHGRRTVLRESRGGSRNGHGHTGLDGRVSVRGVQRDRRGRWRLRARPCSGYVPLPGPEPEVRRRAGRLCCRRERGDPGAVGHRRDRERSEHVRERRLSTTVGQGLADRVVDDLERAIRLHTSVEDASQRV